jgi:hypothetical protein
MSRGDHDCQFTDGTFTCALCSDLRRATMSDEYTMRDGSTFVGTYEEAVAEVERLRAELAEWKARAQGHWPPSKARRTMPLDPTCAVEREGRRCDLIAHHTGLHMWINETRPLVVAWGYTNSDETNPPGQGPGPT